MQDTDGEEVEPEIAAKPAKRKSSFGLKKDPLSQTGITSFFNAKEGGAAFQSALELREAIQIIWVIIWAIFLTPFDADSKAL